MPPRALRSYSCNFRVVDIATVREYFMHRALSMAGSAEVLEAERARADAAPLPQGQNRQAGVLNKFTFLSR
jgi:hypothetical protein